MPDGSVTVDKLGVHDQPKINKLSFRFGSMSQSFGDQRGSLRIILLKLQTPQRGGGGGKAPTRADTTYLHVLLLMCYPVQ